MEEVYLNGDFENRYPGIMNISFNYVEGESLIMATKDIAVSSGSACTSASLEPSFVLRALSTKLGSKDADVQADPLETAMSFVAIIRDSPST